MLFTGVVHINEITINSELTADRIRYSEVTVGISYKSFNRNKQVGNKCGTLNLDGLSCNTDFNRYFRMSTCSVVVLVCTRCLRSVNMRCCEVSVTMCSKLDAVESKEVECVSNTKWSAGWVVAAVAVASCENQQSVSCCVCRTIYTKAACTHCESGCHSEKFSHELHILFLQYNNYRNFK